MISQFNQPRGSTSIEVNKQSIARNFGVKEDEVVYFTAGIDLGGFKVIYDESTQRAYSLPSGIVSGTTSISLNEQAILTHSAGSVDLGELAVSREEYVTLPGSFNFGHTINVKNELLVHDDKKYRWDGSLPKVVAAGSTPDSSGGVGLGAWLSVGDAALRAELNTNLSDGTFPATIKYKYGLPSVIDGAIYRTVQDKLDDFVFLEDFGGGTDVSDNTDAFKKAFATSKAVKLKSGTYRVVDGYIELPAQYLLVGEGRSTEIACGSNTAFTFTGALGTLKRAGIMRDLSISTDPRSNVLVYTHAEQARFYNVFFYHIAYIMDDAHYFYFYDCESYGCFFEVKPDSNTTSYLNESIVFLRSFFSACNIYAKNTAELTLINCIMFSSPYYAVKTETVFLSPTENDEAIGFPAIVIGTTFDAIQGTCLELKDAPYSVISGNFFSSWTGSAVRLDSCRSVKVSDNNIAAANVGVDLENCKYIAINNNVFNECNTVTFGAINLTSSTYIGITGNIFANAKVYGTDHTNVITKGVTNNDSTATHVVISSNIFGESVTTPTNISTSETTANRIIGNVGVHDSAGNMGGTASRPSSPNSGDMYYDTNLGSPIWWNGVTLTWKNAAGADV